MSMGTSLRPTFTTLTGTSPPPFFPALGGGEPLLVQPHRPTHATNSRQPRRALIARIIQGNLTSNAIAFMGFQANTASFDDSYCCLPAESAFCYLDVPKHPTDNECTCDWARNLGVRLP